MENDRTYILKDTLLTSEIKDGKVKVSNWHISHVGHKWIIGSSNGGGSNSTGQYIYVYTHELIDGLPANQQEKYKTIALECLENDDGFNSEYNKMHALVNQIKSGG